MHTEQRRGHAHLSLGLALVVLSLALPGQAQEGSRRVPLSTPQRTALVIGNSQYGTGPLHNSVNDAKDMADVLKRIGFAVTLLTDVNQAQMETAVVTLSQHLRYGGVGLFYFAGHNMQLDGQNYLWPVGTSMTSPADVRYKAVQASWVQARMEEAGNALLWLAGEGREAGSVAATAEWPGAWQARAPGVEPLVATSGRTRETCRA
jgi:hypothetical protein